MNGLLQLNRGWNPFREMENLRNKLDQYFGGALNRVPIAGGENQQEAVRLTEWAPLVDISEDDKEYVIKVDLPEVNKEDLTVKVEDGVVTITGERKFEKEQKSKRYHRVERAYGSFTRAFTVPDDADGEKVSAEFKDGLLRVRLAKSERAKAKTVQVKVD